MKVLSKSVPEKLDGPVEVVTVAGGELLLYFFLSSLYKWALQYVGCFWGIELAFQRVPGVIKTEVGYCQGFVKNPSYEEVCSGQSGHAEAVQITFDKSVVQMDELLDVLFDIIDPTTYHRQGNDVGSQYRSGIYFHDENQKAVALASLEKQRTKYTDRIVTEVEALQTWYPAEDYHQQYLAKGGQCSLTGDLSPIRCYG